MVGEVGSWSESVDEMERRLVRAGVRVGYAGGPLELDAETKEALVLVRCNGGRMGVASSAIKSSSSNTVPVSGCRECFAGVIRLRSVLSLCVRWIMDSPSFTLTESKGSWLDWSSGVVGAEVTNSEDALMKVESDASDEMAETGFAMSRG